MKQRNTNKTNPAALIYCRVSTEKQEQEGTSLDSQADACIEYAKQNGYQIAEVVKETFSGAYLFDRPKLNEERAKLRAGAYAAVIVYAIDRLSRDIAHLAILSDEVQRYGAKLHFVTEDLDNTAEGKLMLSVRSYVAEVERIKIRERSTRGKTAKVKDGKLFAPSIDMYGYTVDKERGVRVINETEAALVRRIFSEYVGGKTIRAIVDLLNSADTPPPSTGKRIYKNKRFSRFGGRTLWTKGIISKILKREDYTGVSYYLKTQAVTEYKNGNRKRTQIIKPRSEWVKMPDGVTPAIIDAGLFNAVQTRLANGSANGVEKRNETRPALFRNLIYCKCGRKMYPDFDNRGKYTYLRYICGSVYAPERCEYFFDGLSNKKLEVAVWAKIKAAFTNPDTLRLELAQRASAGDTERAIVQADIEAATVTLERVNAEIATLTKRIAVVSDEIFDLINSQINEKIKERKRIEEVLIEAEKRLASFEENLAELVAIEQYADTFAPKLDTIGFDEKRNLCEFLGLKIVAHDRKTVSLTISIPTEEVLIDIFSGDLLTSPK